MSIDYAALSLDMIYSILSSNLELDDGRIIEAIDKTSGISISDTIGIETIKPAVVVKKQSLINEDITIDILLGTYAIINGKQWIIESSKPSPGINGEDDGEVYLFLREYE